MPTEDRKTIETVTLQESASIDSAFQRDKDGFPVEIGRGETVLDVACGTGWATLEAARTVGQTGRVVGIDIADKALTIAREKADHEGLDNIKFEQQDGHRLKFGDCVFDVVACASALLSTRMRSGTAAAIASCRPG